MIFPFRILWPKKKSFDIWNPIIDWSSKPPTSFLLVGLNSVTALASIIATFWFGCSLQTQNRITVFLCQGKFDGIDWVFKGKKQKTKLDLRPKSDLFQILQPEFKTKSWFFLEKKYQNYIQLQIDQNQIHNKIER